MEEQREDLQKTARVWVDALHSVITEPEPDQLDQMDADCDLSAARVAAK